MRRLSRPPDYSSREPDEAEVLSNRDIRSRRSFLFLCGKGSYSSLGGEYPYKFCRVYREEYSSFADCEVFK